MEDSITINEEKPIDEPKNTKTKKRKHNNIEDDDVVASVKKMDIKGIMLSVTKPSYTLKKGIGRELRSLRSEHRNRLRYLLRQLVRRQNWDEACGVLSLLLKGTYRESGGLLNNRIKYWATLELLQHMKVAKLKDKAVQVYDLWMKKDTDITKKKRYFKDLWMKDTDITKKKRYFKGRFDVHLEYLLFCLSRGDTQRAKDSVPSLQQDEDFSEDPIANLFAGLFFSHLWYNSIPKEALLHESLECSSPIQSGTSGPGGSMLIDNSNGQSAVEIQDSDAAFIPDLNTSIRLGKEGINQERKVLMEVGYEPKKEILDYEELHMNSDESDQNGNASRFLHTGDKIYGSIVSAHDLEYMLMPITFPKTKDLEYFSFIQERITPDDHYKLAVKHLRNALHSSPPAFEALLPLIQMLLIGDQVKLAIEEVESVVQNSHAALPFRLKASLLEHFSKEDANKLSICFEDTLRKDPTCSHSLAKLISLHHVGDYSIERLVEMIALYLDATYASYDIWKEFASCFIELSGYDEDRMSSCVYSYGDSHTEFSKEIPDMFQDKVTRENWRLRCRWWMTRHFTQTILASEVTSGNFELVAYKAASACHLYGPEFAYVIGARRYLEKERIQDEQHNPGNMTLVAYLKEHMKNAIGFTQHNTRSWASSYI